MHAYIVCSTCKVRVCPGELIVYCVLRHSGMISTFVNSPEHNEIAKFGKWAEILLNEVPTLQITGEFQTCCSSVLSRRCNAVEI